MRTEEWLQELRAMGRLAQEGISGIWGTPEAGDELGVGAGGDTTILADKVIEDILVERLEAIGDVRLISEERGRVDIGEPTVTVIADPLDGSFNAKMGIPLFAISLALLEGGSTFGHMTAALVRNLVTGDEYYAVRGGGAFFNGGRIRTSSREEVSVIGMECHPNTSLALRQNLAIVEGDTRVRSLGCMSLDLCHVARGVFDAYVDVRGRVSRVVDMAAGNLIVVEAGGVVTDGRGGSLSGMALEVDTRLDFIASGNEKVHGKVLERLAGG